MPRNYAARQMNHNMIKCPEVVPRSESTSKVDEPKEMWCNLTCRQSRFHSWNTTMVNLLGYPLPKKAELFSENPTQRIRDRTTDKAQGTPENSMGTVSIQPMTGPSVVIHVRRYEDGNQQERMWCVKKNILSELWTGWSKPPQRYIGCYRGNIMQ